MPYKSLEEKRKYNREYHKRRYATDPEFKKKKCQISAEWRKAKNGTYYQYMKEYMTKKKQYALWMKYRIAWKAQKNTQAYLEVLRALEMAEYNRRQLPVSKLLTFSEQ